MGETLLTALLTVLGAFALYGFRDAVLAATKRWRWARIVGGGILLFLFVALLVLFVVAIFTAAT